MLTTTVTRRRRASTKALVFRKIRGLHVVRPFATKATPQYEPAGTQLLRRGLERHDSKPALHPKNPRFASDSIRSLNFWASGGESSRIACTKGLPCSVKGCTHPKYRRNLKRVVSILTADKRSPPALRQSQRSISVHWRYLSRSQTKICYCFSLAIDS